MLALILITCGVCALSVFVLGRISTAPEPEDAFLGLSDTTLAFVIHEAQRAYQRSLGVIKTKTWNNLSEAEREAKTDAVNAYRHLEGAAGSF